MLICLVNQHLLLIYSLFSLMIVACEPIPALLRFGAPPGRESVFCVQRKTVGS